MGELKPGQTVWRLVRSSALSDLISIEARTVLHEADDYVALREPLMPAGFPVKRASVFDTEAAVIAAYWQAWEEIRTDLLKRVKRVGKRLRERKPPRIRKDR